LLIAFTVVDSLARQRSGESAVVFIASTPLAGPRCILLRKTIAEDAAEEYTNGMMVLL